MRKQPIETYQAIGLALAVLIGLVVLIVCFLVLHDMIAGIIDVGYIASLLVDIFLLLERRLLVITEDIPISK